MKKVFLLGAADPEMAEIEAVVRAHGASVLYAAKDGRRVHPGNAYKADSVLGESWEPTSEGQVGYRVECDAAANLSTGEMVVIDHHFPGDPGFGRGPEEFLQASSLGQVLDVFGLQATEQQRLAAAADHCLAAAYRGECPGVDPEALMNWRAASRAAFQKRAVEDVLRDIEAAREVLASATKTLIAGVEVADLGDQTVAEVPEAAARDGQPFTAEVVDRDRRRKVVLQAAPPAVVEAFMAGHRADDREVYGDPARGFAGAFLA